MIRPMWALFATKGNLLPLFKGAKTIALAKGNSYFSLASCGQIGLHVCVWGNLVYPLLSPKPDGAKRKKRARIRGGAKSMAASGSGSGGGGGGGIQPELGGRIAPRECESCRSAPGIPFCRVEWSFLCTGCAAVVHGHNWIVAVPPNPSPNPNPNPYVYPYAYPFPVPNPNLNPNPSAGGDPNHVVQLSSDEEAPSSDGGANGAGAVAGGKRRRRSDGGAAPGGRMASVMRYMEKRKIRKFEKTVRYETRKVYAEMRPRVDGKFARPDAGGEEARADAGEAAERLDANEQMRSDVSEEVRVNSSDEVGLPEKGGDELRQLGSADEARLE